MHAAGTELFAPVCSITTTQRRRFFWAAWWNAPPSRVPFRKPDASDGGASTHQEALDAAERRVGSKVVVIDARWARAWIRVLRGEGPWRSSTEPAPRLARAAGTVSNESVWAILGVTRDVTAAELKLAYRRRALETHPDHGGDPESFQKVVHAYREAALRLRKPRPRRDR
jgi:hypothetical protein